MTVYSIDRCAVCRTTIHLDWSAEPCPGGHVVVCAGCAWEDGCHECERTTT